MMKRNAFFSIFAVVFEAMSALTLTSCATPTSLGSRSALFKEAKSAVVISGLDAQVGIDYFGSTVFTNFGKVIPLAKSKLDERMLSYATNALGKSVGSVRLIRDVQLKATTYKPLEYRFAKGSSEEFGRTMFAKYLPEGLPDLILWVGSWTEKPVLGLTNQPPHGHRLVAPLVLVLFDGRTGKEIYGLQPSIFCGTSLFDYKADDLGKELEKNQAALEQKWGSCMERQIDAFLSESGLSK
jgi:hypothetical protein